MPDDAAVTPTAAGLMPSFTHQKIGIGDCSHPYGLHRRTGIHAHCVIGALIGVLVGLCAGLGAGLWIGFDYGLLYGIAGGAAAGVVTAVVVAKITNILAHALLKIAMVLSAVGFAVWAWLQYVA